MKIKVCGMRSPENIANLSQLPIDYIGFIFHPSSPRFADIQVLDSIVPNIRSGIQRVGVFVNAPIRQVVDYYKRLQLHYVQLHGGEPLKYVQQLRDLGISIIKTFSVHRGFDWNQPERFAPFCDLFLFDTFTVRYGGSGRHFDWNLLKNYCASLPFLLSGGIAARDIARIQQLSHPRLQGIDLNSQWEVSPGIKNIQLLQQLVQTASS